MKFKCGPKISREEKERILYQQLVDRFCRWHKIFAFFPHKVADNDCRWLETIERKFDYVSTFDWAPRHPDYRAISKED